MKKRNIAMLVILAVLFVIAAVLTVVGIATHEEAGLLGFCEDETYSDDCPPVVWSHVPVSITAMSEDPLVDAESAIRSAIDTVNTRLGFEMLRYDPDPGHCMEAHSICVRIGEAREPDWMDTAGDARHWLDGPQLHCDVRTSNTGTSEMLNLVLQHEIGHCLGLAHDDFDSSIMRNTDMRHVPDGQFPPRITDHDRILLRGRYNSSN